MHKIGDVVVSETVEAVMPLFEFVRNEIFRLINVRTPATVKECEYTSKENQELLFLILLSGDSCRILVKSHCSSNDAKLFMKANSSDTSQNFLDFGKEFLNIVSGHLQKGFSDVGVQMQHSLPMHLHGSAEKFLKKNSDLEYEDVYCVQFAENSQIQFSTLLLEIDSSINQKLEALEIRDFDGKPGELEEL